MGQILLTFVAACGATAFVSSAIKEDEDKNLAKATARMFGVLVAGIAAFALVIEAVTFLAG